MNPENLKPSTWGQLRVALGTAAGQQRALPPDIEAHIRAITAPDTEPLPLDTQRWFRALVREYAAGRQRLDEVMGLAPVSAKRDWRTIDRMEARNAWLARAFELLEGVSVYSRCVELSERIYTFQEAFWPKLEDCTTPPEEMTLFRQALFFAFKLGEGEVPHGWKSLMRIVQQPPIAPETCSILWHIHADAYDQSRSITIDPQTTIGKSDMTEGLLAILTLYAWDSSAELRARHDDITDYHQRIIRQAMDCDLDEGEIPALIAEVLSQEQIADAFKRTRVKINEHSS